MRVRYLCFYFMYISVRACHVRLTTVRPRWVSIPGGIPGGSLLQLPSAFWLRLMGHFFGPTRYPTGDSFRQELVMKRAEANDGLLAGP